MSVQTDSDSFSLDNVKHQMILDTFEQPFILPSPFEWLLGHGEDANEGKVQEQTL